MRPVGSGENIASVKGQAKIAGRVEHGIVRKRSTLTSDIDKPTEVS